MKTIKLTWYYPKRSNVPLLCGNDEFSILMMRHLHPEGDSMAYPDDFKRSILPLMAAHGVTEIIYPEDYH